MSFSNNQLPGSYYVVSAPAFREKGGKLSDFFYNRPDMLRLRMVTVNDKNTIEPELSIPTIHFDINPKNISFSFSKAINSSVYSRAGFIPQLWGDELDTIQVQGTSAAFIHETQGLTRQKAQDTVGYKNFFNLILFYRNNGSQYSTVFNPKKPSSSTGQTLSRIRTDYKNKDKSSVSFFSSSPRKIIDTKLLVELQYSTLKAYGSFNAFNYTETTDKAFNFDYNFEFTPLFYDYNLTNPNFSVQGHLSKKKQ
jgi:hypothetical protein